MNSFVTLRDIDTFSKRHMFKINPTFPKEYFHVRAGECAWYILHRFSKVVKNSTFFIVFRGSEIMYIFVVSRNINIFSKQKMFKINNSFDEERSEVRAVQCARAIFYIIFSEFWKKLFSPTFRGYYVNIFFLSRHIGIHMHTIASTILYKFWNVTSLVNNFIQMLTIILLTEYWS